MKPTMRIGASSYVGDYVMPKALVDWEKMNPEIELKIDVSDSERVFTGVIEGTLEAGAIGAALEDERIQTEEFVHNADELILIAPASHPFANKNEVTVHELKGQRFIVREPGSATRMWYRERLAVEDLTLDDMDIVCEVNSHQAAISAVEAGAGISFVLRGAARDALDTGRVKEVRVKELSPLMGSLYLVHLDRRLLSDQGKQVLGFLEDEKAKLTAFGKNRSSS
ncbi:MAG: LysR substrate-binding domain-containing protein [Chloroflexi bacterium]|nr:LysR substrate-binding domain-containing protein [Chloroflexota bacterium]